MTPGMPVTKITVSMCGATEVKPPLDEAVVDRILKSSIPGFAYTSGKFWEEASADTSPSEAKVFRLEDEEGEGGVISFFVSEILENLQHCLQSPAHLQEVIGPHLVDFGICLGDAQCAIVCDDIYECLIDPPEHKVPPGDEVEREDMDDEVEPGQCVICLRGPMPMTFHHLVPKKTHRKLKKKLSAKELQAGILICRQCHSAIHRFLDHNTLAAEFNTLEKLMQHEQLARWAAYAAKQKVVGSKHGLRYKR